MFVALLDTFSLPCSFTGSVEVWYTDAYAFTLTRPVNLEEPGRGGVNADLKIIYTLV